MNEVLEIQKFLIQEFFQSLHNRNTKIKLETEVHNYWDYKKTVYFPKFLTITNKPKKDPIKKSNHCKDPFLQYENHT